jgi:hypothetical protein
VIIKEKYTAEVKFNANYDVLASISYIPVVLEK